MTFPFNSQQFEESCLSFLPSGRQVVREQTRKIRENQTSPSPSLLPPAHPLKKKESQTESLKKIKSCYFFFFFSPQIELQQFRMMSILETPKHFCPPVLSGVGHVGPSSFLHPPLPSPPTQRYQVKKKD